MDSAELQRLTSTVSMSVVSEGKADGGSMATDDGGVMGGSDGLEVEMGS